MNYKRIYEKTIPPDILYESTNPRFFDDDGEDVDEDDQKNEIFDEIVPAIKQKGNFVYVHSTDEDNE